MEGKSLTATDAIALQNEGMNDMNSWFWVVILLFLFRGNNYGNNDNQFLERDIFNTNQNVSNTGCQTQRDVLENRYNTQLGLTNLGMQMQNCCCESQKEILQNRYDNALQTQTLSSQLANCCCDLKASGIENTQKILDKLCENEINQLRTDLQSAQLQISQLSQTANITNTLRPFPQPAYITCSPYQAYQGYGYGCGNNC